MSTTMWSWLLLLAGATVTAFRAECDTTRLLKAVASLKQNVYVYILTQDCQLVFSRADQLDQLQNYMEVGRDLSHCKPGLVQLHLRDVYNDGRIGLTLVMKRSHNQICTLPLDFPAENAFAGYSVFSYSLLNSMSYAVCSYMTNSSFRMEPEMSFMDSAFSDIIYFVDPQSAGSFWSIKQFKIEETGYLTSLESFIVKNFAEESGFSNQMAQSYLIALDSERSQLYAVNRNQKDMASTCAYDLLFRPHRSKYHRRNLGRTQYSQRKNSINSFAADVNISLYSETEMDPSGRMGSKIFMVDKRASEPGSCLLRMPYLAKVGIISQQAINELNTVKLPRFDEKVKERRKLAKPQQQVSGLSAHPDPLIPSIPTRNSHQWTRKPSRPTTAPPTTTRPRTFWPQTTTTRWAKQWQSSGRTSTSESSAEITEGRTLPNEDLEENQRSGTGPTEMGQGSRETQKAEPDAAGHVNKLIVLTLVAVLSAINLL